MKKLLASAKICICTVVASTVAVVSSGSVGALSCVPRALGTQFDVSDIVFVGQVNEVTRDEAGDSVAELEVNEVYKGAATISVGNVIEITDTAFGGSGISFAEKRDVLLVFAELREDRYITPDCNGTTGYGNSGAETYGYDDAISFRGDLVNLKNQYEILESMESNSAAIQNQLEQNSDENQRIQILLASLLSASLLLTVYLILIKNKKS